MTNKEKKLTNKQSIQDQLMYGTGIEDKDWNRIDPRKFELDMTNKEKLEKIYAEIPTITGYPYPFKVIHIWDCLQYIEDNKRPTKWIYWCQSRCFECSLLNSINDLLDSWKDKRQPIDNERLAIDLMISLIDNK